MRIELRKQVSSCLCYHRLLNFERKPLAAACRSSPGALRALTEVQLVAQNEWLVEGTSTSGHWRVGRIAARREDCILVRLTAPDGIYGQACAPYSDALRREMQNELRAKKIHD